MCAAQLEGFAERGGDASDSPAPVPSPGGADSGERTGADPGIAEYVDRIAEEMHERVELQRRLIREVLSDRGSVPERRTYCPSVDCERLSRLKAAVGETIAVLDETRSAFKSKRLEVMRKKLIDTLAGC